MFLLYKALGSKKITGLIDFQGICNEGGDYRKMQDLDRVHIFRKYSLAFIVSNPPLSYFIKPIGIWCEELEYREREAINRF